MAEWLKEHGVAKKRIITEDRSQTTAQNAVFTSEILFDKYPQVKNVAIVSSDYTSAWAGCCSMNSLSSPPIRKRHR